MDFGVITGRLTNLNFLIPVFAIAVLEDAIASRTQLGEMIGRRSGS